MKDKILSVSKKIAVILIASIMVLGVVPISMITMRNHTADAKGAFLRLSPEAETVVMPRMIDKKYQLSHQTEGVLSVGEDSDAYLRFDLQDLIQDKKLKEIKEATLRLTFLNLDTDKKMPVRFWLMPYADWHRNMDYSNKPSTLGEVKLAELMPEFDRQEATVIELDLTPYISRWIAEENPRISFHLDSEGHGISAGFAGTGYEDALYRPCLKIVTGEATDPDTDDISKVWLEKSAQSGGAHRDGLFRAGKGKEFYLKFNLKPENIRGAMYETHLQLDIRSIEPGAELQIYQLAHGQWNEGEHLPQGQENLVAFVTDPEEMQQIDLTDAVNDAYARGETSLTLRLAGGREAELAVEETPYLHIRVSDQADVVAVTEAAIYALEDNASPHSIEGDLSESYTTEHGVRAEVRWGTWDPVTETEAGEVLSKEGRITRPKWYENSRTIRARATISSGEFQRDRVYQLNILPEELPEDFKRELDAYLNLGADADEQEQAFAARGGEEHLQFRGGRSFSYRVLEQNDILAMTMKTNGEMQNYLTLKVWKTEQPTSALRVENLKDREKEPISCVYPAEMPQEDGFLYLTYSIPTSWTEQEEHISIRMYPEESKEETWIPWEIYGIYTGQTPYFDPLTFAEQGERFAGKETGEGSAFLRLLRRMYLAAKRPWEDFTQRWKGEEAGVIPETEALPVEPAVKDFVWMETKPPILAFEDQEDKIAISVTENERKAQIHRSSNYYDTYAEVEVQDYGEGLSAVDYGMYQVVRNASGRERRVPWRNQEYAGIYQDIADGKCYVFLQEGQMADDSVLTPGTILEAGENLRLSGGKTLVLKRLSKPLYQEEWRIRAIDGKSVSEIMLNKDLHISQLTVKSMGSVEDQQEMQVFCCTYEGGKLAGMSCESFSLIPGQTEYQVEVTPMTVLPGQTLKIFIEPYGKTPEGMIPKLELP